MTRALASNFEEAESYSKKPQPKPYGNGESVSKYFTAVNAHASLFDIRQTDYFKVIKDDPVFVEFPEHYELVPVEDVIKVRDRPDLEEEDVMQDIKEEGEVHDGEQDHSVMDHLERALSSNPNGTSPSAPTSNADDETGARPGVMKVFPVDRQQEDVLAALGVEGPPQPVFPTPGPAYAQASTDDAEGSQHAEASALAPANELVAKRSPEQDERHPSSQHPPPPPPPPEQEHYLEPQRHRSTSYDPWNDDHRMPTNGRHSPARSDKSNHTGVGSDFGQDTMEGAQQTNGSGVEMARTAPANDDMQPPPFHRSERSPSRKRSYEHFDDQENEPEQLRQAEDPSTKKSKRNSKSAVGAYGYVLLFVFPHSLANCGEAVVSESHRSSLLTRLPRAQGDLLVIH